MMNRVRKLFGLSSNFHAVKRHYASELPEALWKLTNYRFFLPVQSRWQDNDGYNHVNYSLYYTYAGLMTTRFISQYCDGDQWGQFAVYSHCTYRSSLRYPEIPLAGLASTKIGKSSIELYIALFRPKSVKFDPTAGTGLSLYGSFADNLDMDKIQQRFEGSAVALVHTTQVLVDMESEKATAMSPKAVDSFQKIFIPT